MMAEHQDSSGFFRVNYEILEYLGEGTFGTVSRCKNKLDERECAVKKIKLRCSYNEEQR